MIPDPWPDDRETGPSDRWLVLYVAAILLGVLVLVVL